MRGYIAAVDRLVAGGKKLYRACEEVGIKPYQYHRYKNNKRTCAPETSTMPNDQDKKERGPLAGTPETSNAMPDVQRQDDTHREAS